MHLDLTPAPPPPALPHAPSAARTTKTCKRSKVVETATGHHLTWIQLKLYRQIRREAKRAWVCVRSRLLQILSVVQGLNLESERGRPGDERGREMKHYTRPPWHTNSIFLTPPPYLPSAHTHMHTAHRSHPFTQPVGKCDFNEPVLNGH